ncbi:MULTISPECIES: hypothetical protein [Pseudomonas]|uniref:Uncharacterized protein n=1 Tax=Pseudomonas kurunegalensis TaxID=485880 RepID=A0ACC5UHQ9_9PSED|nr:MULTISPECIES: hypothetical protein [Pseudomonas]MBC3421864.1 hypothetical protein [Pseudomonas sp. RW3S2]MBV4513872.1 hypothetical protein [Pseudomonas kurunegalensis]
MKESAEDEYRKAFKRLVEGKALRIDKKSATTLANIAREAGRDPSALKRSRYPTFVSEVEFHNENVGSTLERRDRSLSAQLASARAENKSLRARCLGLSAERDAAQSKVLNLQQVLVEKSFQLEGLEGPSNVAIFDQRVRQKFLQRARDAE